MRQHLAAVLLVGGIVLTAGTACDTVAANETPPAGGAAPAATPAAAPAEGTQRVTIKVGNSMSFTPSQFAVRAGQPVELIHQNDGVVPHDITLTGGVSQPVKIAAGGGQTARGTFTIDQPGTYAFVCSQPGHAAAGMKGTISAQ